MEIKNRIRRCAETISEGGIAIIPTETVYGVAVALFNEEGFKRVYRLKGRDRNKPLVIMGPSAAALKGFVHKDQIEFFKFISELWPAPLTLVVPCSDAADEAGVNRQGFVGIRVPDNSLTLELLKLTGPILVTSANESGMPEAAEVSDLSEAIISGVDIVMDGGPCPLKQPSTVVKTDGKSYSLLREGSFAIKEFEAKAAMFGKFEKH